MEKKWLEGKSGTVGMKLVYELAKQINGEITYKKEEGAVFSIKF